MPEEMPVPLPSLRGKNWELKSRRSTLDDPLERKLLWRHIYREGNTLLDPISECLCCFSKRTISFINVFDWIPSKIVDAFLSYNESRFTWNDRKEWLDCNAAPIFLKPSPSMLLWFRVKWLHFFIANVNGAKNSPLQPVQPIMEMLSHSLQAKLSEQV